MLRLLWEQSDKRWQGGYNESWLVKIIFNVGQALGDELSVHLLVTGQSACKASGTRYCSMPGRGDSITEEAGEF